jgi:putative NADH-flavin reductase
MRITVVGGNKGTGAQVVRIAVEAGHEVTCLSRSGGVLPDGVRSLVGDALDADVARNAVAGADAVVVTVGGAAGTDRNRAAVTSRVIAAMRDAGVRRLIVHSSLGVGDSMDLIAGPARLFVRAVLGRALADHAEQEAAVAASGLDWTVVRPGGLTDGPATGAYLGQETAERRPMKSRIARADVAAYIVSVLDDPSSFGRATALGTP